VTLVVAASRRPPSQIIDDRIAVVVSVVGHFLLRGIHERLVVVAVIAADLAVRAYVINGGVEKAVSISVAIANRGRVTILVVARAVANFGPAR
jgi:hypothetical protein